MAAARAMATQLGMSWAANHTDLLKLGPAAIKALHDVGVQRERFERMTGDKVGFKAETAVAIARFAKRHNLTPEQTNRLYDDISKGAEIVSGGNKHIQRELDQATREYVSGPDTPEAREKFQKAWGKHAKTPEQQQAASQATQAVIDAAAQAKAKEARAEVAEQKVAADVAKRNDTLDELDNLAAPPQGTTEPTKRAEAAPEPVKKTEADQPTASQTTTATNETNPGEKKQQVATAQPKPNAPKLV
jgi:hypothetical protein